jgi:IS5 family transposase
LRRSGYQFFATCSSPYVQFFCGEAEFRHVLLFDRSSRTRWRQRLGEEHLTALLESLSVAHHTDALATKDLEPVAVATTVQPKAVANPTDIRLIY